MLKIGYVVLDKLPKFAYQNKSTQKHAQLSKLILL